MRRRDEYLNAEEDDYECFIVLQNVAQKYTREYMFKKVTEREDIISKVLQEIEKWERAIDDYYFNVVAICNGNKVKVKK